MFSIESTTGETYQMISVHYAIPKFRSFTENIIFSSMVLFRTNQIKSSYTWTVNAQNSSVERDGLVYCPSLSTDLPLLDFCLWSYSGQIFLQEK